MLICISCCISFAQGDYGRKDEIDIFLTLQDRGYHTGVVTIIQDDRIGLLVKKHINRNKKQNGIPGFRIRIYSDTGFDARENSNNAITKFLKIFPEIKIHWEYVSPDYKVYVGNFRTKIEAIKLLKKVKKYFPQAFIIPDKINFPKLD